MDKGLKITLIIGGVVVAAAGVYLAYTYLKPAKPTQQKPSTQPDATSQIASQVVAPSYSPPAVTTASDSPFPLSFGSKGANVVALQNLLNSLGKSLTVDGKFGPATRTAVLSYGIQHPELMNGVVDNAAYSWLQSLTYTKQATLGDSIANLFKI